MKNPEAVQMMNRCMQEILGMRATIAQLQPKAEAYDSIVTILRLLPRPSTGASEDLVWVLNRRISQLKEENDQ